MPCLCICDHGCQCGFASGSCCSRNCNQKRQLFVYFQDSLHLGKGLVRLGDSCAYCFGTVHTGAAAKSDNGLASGCVPQVFCFFHIVSGRIGYGFVINGISNPILFQCCFKTYSKAEFPDPQVCNDQHVVNSFFLKKLRQSFYTSDDFRITVRKEWKGKFKCILKNAAVDFSCFIHG